MTARVDVIIDIAWTTLCTSCSGLRSIPARLKYSRTTRRTVGADLDGRQKFSFAISCGAMAACEANRWSLGKAKTRRIRAHAPVAQISHLLFRSDESRIKLAPHQGFGEHRRVITRQPDLNSGKLVAKDAVHRGQQANFGPRHEAKSECRSRRLSCRIAASLAASA